MTFVIPRRRRQVSFRTPKRELWCPVVAEHVVATLRRCDDVGRAVAPYVRCNERECQYADRNQPPCPLTSAMFDAKLRAWSRRRTDGRA